MRSEIPTNANKRVLWVFWAFYKNTQILHRFTNTAHVLVPKKKTLRNKSWHRGTSEKKNCFKELAIPLMCIYNCNNIKTVGEYGWEQEKRRNVKQLALRCFEFEAWNSSSYLTTNMLSILRQISSLLWGSVSFPTKWGSWKLELN